MAYFVDEEIVAQPDCWRRVSDIDAPLPDKGLRVATVGCGTSWFMGMTYAVRREAAGHGWTDAFTASEFPLEREYDAIVAISRSGTTTEVADVLTRYRGPARKIALVGVEDTPVADAADDVVSLAFADERSVVQTRFATTALAVLRASVGDDLAPVIEGAETALAAELPDAAVSAEQLTFLGHGWTVGLAHEAALKVREASQGWVESYPALDYRHGPISIAAPGRAVWMFGAAPLGLAADVERTGAAWLDSDLDPMAHLVLAQRVAVARARAAGLDPDHPRSLTRSVVLK